MPDFKVKSHGTMSLAVSFPEGLLHTDLDRKTVMTGLADVNKKWRQTAKRLLSTKGVSKPGEFPGKKTGRMRRAVKIHKAKKTEKMWVRTQVDSFKDVPMWYPAPLTYGRKKGDLKPRANPITASAKLHEIESMRKIDNAIVNAIKGWD